MSPKVAKARPSPKAPSNPALAASLPHAIAVPCPPAKEMLPANKPAAGWASKPNASNTPVAFWMTKNPTAIASSTASALPPAASRRSLADSPMVLKNTSSNRSRTRISKLILTSQRTKIRAMTTLHSSPPVTAGGML